MIKTIQAHLRGLATKATQPQELKLGICSELESLAQILGLKRITFDPTEWRHYSGMCTYPVPISAGDNRVPQEFFYTRNKWNDSEYADLRRDLCRYLATTEGVITYDT